MRDLITFIFDNIYDLIDIMMANWLLKGFLVLAVLNFILTHIKPKEEHHDERKN